MILDARQNFNWGSFLARIGSYLDNSSQTVSRVKYIDGLVDIIKCLESVGYERVDIQLSHHNFIYELWYIFSAFPSSKSCSFPLTTSNKLERSSCDLFASSSDSDNATLSKASMCCFKSGSHYRNITCAIISIVNSPFFSLEEPIFRILI